MLKPSYELSVGSLTSNTASPVAGPRSFMVARDMDVPVDVLEIHLMERAKIATGDSVTLDLGHDEENERAFIGTVAQIVRTIEGVRVIALGKMNELVTCYTSGTYETRTFGNIVDDLISQAGLDSGTIDDGPEVTVFAVDRRRSAFTHVKKMANRLGFELYTDRNGNVMFHALGGAADLDNGGLLGAAASAVGNLIGLGSEGYHFGQNVLSAKILNRQQAWQSVTIGGESPMSWQGDSTAHFLTINDQDNKGEAGSGNPQRLIRDAAARTKDLADRFATGHLYVNQRTVKQVVFRVLGHPQVDLGDSLSLSGMQDELLNGSGYVRAITHHFDTHGGFVTDFRISIQIE